MLVAALFLVGGGLTAAGMLWSGLYDVGVLVLLVAAVGVVVRAGEWVRIMLARRPDTRPAKPGAAGSSTGDPR